jgi:hypothetical protein
MARWFLSFRPLREFSARIRTLRLRNCGQPTICDGSPGSAKPRIMFTPYLCPGTPRRGETRQMTANGPMGPYARSGRVFEIARLHMPERRRR